MLTAVQQTSGEYGIPRGVQDGCTRRGVHYPGIQGGVYQEGCTLPWYTGRYIPGGVHYPGIQGGIYQVIHHSGIQGGIYQVIPHPGSMLGM